MGDEKITIRELSKIAENNGFFLCPSNVWNETINTIDQLRTEKKQLIKARDSWKEKLRLSKSIPKKEVTSN